MTSALYQNQTKQKRLEVCALLIWIVIMVLVGTHFRSRKGDEALEADWLVLAQILACCIGGVVGSFLIFKGARPCGLGARSLLIYSFTIGVSVLFLSLIHI